MKEELGMSRTMIGSPRLVHEVSRSPMLTAVRQATDARGDV
jgi:hypothetical protein